MRSRKRSSNGSASSARRRPVDHDRVLRLGADQIRERRQLCDQAGEASTPVASVRRSLPSGRIVRSVRCEPPMPVSPIQAIRRGPHAGLRPGGVEIARIPSRSGDRVEPAERGHRRAREDDLPSRRVTSSALRSQVDSCGPVSSRAPDPSAFIDQMLAGQPLHDIPDRLRLRERDAPPVGGDGRVGLLRARARETARGTCRARDAVEVRRRLAAVRRVDDRAPSGRELQAGGGGDEAAVVAAPGHVRQGSRVASAGIREADGEVPARLHRRDDPGVARRLAAARARIPGRLRRLPAPAGRHVDPRADGRVRRRPDRADDLIGEAGRWRPRRDRGPCHSSSGS